MKGEYYCEGEVGNEGRNCPICGAPLSSRGIEIKEQYVVANGNAVMLSPVELLIFSRLLKSFPGSVARELVYEALISKHVTEADWPEEKTLNTHICHIRQKVAKVGLEIKTVHGVGFRILHRQKEEVA